MSCLERFGASNDTIVTLEPAALGIQVRDSDIVDIATELQYNRVLTSLDLTECAMSIESATAIGKTLKESNRNIIAHVRFSKCDLNAQSIVPLADLFTRNNRIEAADFSENSLRDEGALAVAKGIEQNTMLRVLDLAACKIGPAGAAALGGSMQVNAKLRSLSLSNNKLREAGTEALCKGLRVNGALSTLDLSGNSINREGGMAIAHLLRANRTIEALNVARNYLSDSIPFIASALCERNVAARLLDISSNRITAEVCKAMSQVLEGHQLSIACLSVERNAIENDGLIALYHALKGTGLQFLDLSQCSLSSHSCVVVADLISACPQLNSLQLDGNDLGDESSIEIAAALGNSRSLASLNLERTYIGQNMCRALSEGILKQRKIRSLNLAENKMIGIDGAIPLLEALATIHTLEELDLSDCNLGDSEVLLRNMVHTFVGNPSLPSITLDYNTISSGFVDGRMTRAYALELLDVSMGGHEEPPSKASVLATTRGVSSLGNRSMNLTGGLGAMVNATGGAKKVDLSTDAAVLFRPSWATTTPMTHQKTKGTIAGGVGGGDDDDDEDGDDGAAPPMVPRPDSLHHPLYPGYGKGRFSNGHLVQTLSDAVSYSTSISHGARPRFRPTGDGASLMSAAPRRPMKQSPYSLVSLENNAAMLPVTEDQLRKKFNELDVDGNGYLDREEFKAVYKTFQTYGIRQGDRDVEECFKKNCIWEDGKVSFDEFCIVMLQVARR